jgi:membrane protein implicated in regulation of membrane protease activity
MLMFLRQSLHKLFSWSGWPRLAAIATALTAVAALWFSAQSLRSTERQYTLSEQGQITDRFTKAVEQLGSDKTDVRLGGIYSLERLARDSPPDHGVIIEVLGAYVRTHAAAAKACNPSAPPSDVQATITVLGRREPQPFALIDLSDACLYAAILQDAYLERAFLPLANLSHANLAHANLSDAAMFNMDLTDAYLVDTDLESADLAGADLKGADLEGANLTGANLSGVNLANILYDESTVWPEDFSPPPSRPNK